MNDGQYIYCGTRTGRKAHVAWSTSSVTLCGHWLKTQASAYGLSARMVGQRDECEKCAEIKAASSEIEVAA